jgi:LysR family cys regulon transcriptional activator
MTLQQLIFLRAVVRHGMNISAAAASLHTSQPGMSRQIQLLERELGLPVLVRRRNRILGLTELGAAVAGAGDRLLNEAENIRQIAADAKSSGGRLIVATSHLHARYTLLEPFTRLRKAYPEVELLLLQSTPNRIVGLVQSGEADIGVSSGTAADAAGNNPDVAILASAVLRRSAIVAKDHELSNRKRVTLAEISRFPLIGYGPNTQTGLHLSQAFSALGLSPRYVVRASDSDIIQAFVRQGLGVGIVPTASIAGKADAKLVAIDVTKQMPEARTVICLRKGAYPRRHLIDFIRMIAPTWDEARIHSLLAAS